MKTLKATDLTDGEFEAVFKAAAAQSVARAEAAGKPVPSLRMSSVVAHDDDSLDR